MGSAIHLLLVTESAEDAALMIEALWRGGFETVCERVATEVEMRAALGSGSWEVVIAEYSPPGFGRRSPLELLRKVASDLPCIVVSSREDEAAIVAAMRGGARDYIVKGRWERLVHAVSREVAGSAEWREKRGVTGCGCTVGLSPSKEPYQLLFEVNPHPMWVYDLETLGFLAVNTAAIRQYGYSSEEFLSMTIKDIRPPRGVPKLLDHIAKTSDGFNVAGTWRHRKKDGTIIDVEITTHTVTFAGRPAKLVLAHDIADRLQVEQVLRKSELKYRLLYESMMDAYARIDLQWRIVECNSMFRAMLGYSGNEIYSLTIKNITPEKWHEAEMRIAEKQTFKRGYSDVYEKEYRRSDGTVFPVELRQYLLRDESGNPAGIWAIVRDISERKRTEESLRESEFKYRSLLTNIPDVFWSADSEREIVYISAKFKGLSGYSADEVQGGGKEFWFDRIHADDVASVREAYALFFARSRKYDMEYRFRKKDGCWIWLHDRAFKIYEKDGTTYTNGIIADITKRKRLQEENRALDRELLTLYAIATRLNSTVDSGKMMKYILFKLHNIMRIDYSCIHLLSDKGLLLKNSMGLSKESKGAIRHLPMNTPWVKRVLSGKHHRGKGPIAPDLPEETVHAQDNRVMSAWCAVSLKAGSDVTGILIVGHSMEKNYSEREIFLLKSVANQLAVLIDNHELYERMRDKNRELKRSKETLKKNLEHIKSANIELIRLNEAKSKFIGLASHELKTPITSIYGGVQFLLRYSNLKLSREQREIFSSVFDGISQIRHLVEDLLSISRIEVSGASMQKTPFSLVPLFEDVYDGLILPLSNRNIRVAFVRDEILVPVNEGLLRVVARNLLENAIKFTPDGGTITVSGRGVNRPELLRQRKFLRLFYPEFPQNIAGIDTFYRLDVVDTGIGIPVDELARVFDKFYSIGDIENHTSGRTEFMSEGAGLGLSVVKGAMAGHNGLVWVNSVPGGGGSMFSLLFPLN